MYAIEAVYRNGRIEFLKTPPFKQETKVLVIFPENDDNNSETDESIKFKGSSEMDNILAHEIEWKPQKNIMKRSLRRFVNS